MIEPRIRIRKFNKATLYGIERIPAVVVAGKLLECCEMSSVSENILVQAGVGNG